MGKGNCPKAADSFSSEELCKLYELNILGKSKFTFVLFIHRPSHFQNNRQASFQQMMNVGQTKTTSMRTLAISLTMKVFKRTQLTFRRKLHPVWLDQCAVA